MCKIHSDNEIIVRSWKHDYAHSNWPYKRDTTSSSELKKLYFQDKQYKEDHICSPIINELNIITENDPPITEDNINHIINDKTSNLYNILYNNTGKLPGNIIANAFTDRGKIFTRVVPKLGGKRTRRKKRKSKKYN